MQVCELVPHTVPAQQSRSLEQASRQQAGAAHSAVQVSKSTMHPGSPQYRQLSGMQRPSTEQAVPPQQSPSDVQESPQHAGGAHCASVHSV